MTGRLAGVVLTLALLLGWAEAAVAQARWLRAETPNFVVYTDSSRTTAEMYASRLETFDRVLRTRHGVDANAPVRRKLPIYVLRRPSDIRRIAPGIPADVRGFYRSSAEDIFAVAIADTRGNDPTLQHEYVHHFMLGRYPFGYPAWLIEGYAEYFMTFRETPSYLELGNVNQGRASWLSSPRWLPMNTVLSARPMELRPEQAAMFYAQSWALTHYMLSDPERSRQLNAYLRRVGQGEDSVKAMTAVTGLGPEQLNGNLRRYLSGGFPYGRFSLPPAQRAAPVITELSPAASDLLLLSLRLKNDDGVDGQRDRTDGPVLLADVRTAAGRHPGDPFAERLLARAEVKLGDLGRAEPLLQRRLAADPDDLEALQIAVMARLKAASTATGARARTLRTEGGTFAGRAYKLDPDNYQTLILYAQTRGGASNYPTENDATVLLDALDLAPTVRVLRMNAAQVLAERGKRAEAANVLRSLAFDPHGGEAAAAARSLLTSFEGKASAPAAAPAATGP